MDEEKCQVLGIGAALLFGMLVLLLIESCAMKYHEENMSRIKRDVEIAGKVERAVTIYNVRFTCEPDEDLEECYTRAKAIYDRERATWR